jgi:hypothetical protein
MVVLYFYTVSLGDRSVLISSIVPAFLVYLSNVRRPKWGHIRLLSIFSVAIIGVFSLIRGRPYHSLFSNFNTEDLIYGFKAAFVNNEAFASHFSLYGALKFDIPLKPGYSILSLLVSIVPKIFWGNRPQTIYSYYAEYVGALPGRGYTLHHATGWYLNFGFLGIILGAIIVGWIWVYLYNISQKEACTYRNRTLCLYSKIGFYIFSGYIPIFIRAGIEVYKSAIIGVFFIPLIIIFLSSTKFSYGSCR